MLIRVVCINAPNTMHVGVIEVEESSRRKQSQTCTASISCSCGVSSCRLPSPPPRPVGVTLRRLSFLGVGIRGISRVLKVDTLRDLLRPGVGRRSGAFCCLVAVSLQKPCLHCSANYQPHGFPLHLQVSRPLQVTLPQNVGGKSQTCKILGRTIYPREG